MKKFIALLGVCCALMGLRLFDNGLLNCGYAGTYTVYGRDGSETVYAEENLPKLDRFDAYATRLDFVGGDAEAMQVLKNLNAQMKWRETFDDGLTVIYAYAPDLLRYKTVKDSRVNLMVAIRGNNTVAVGSPLLLGSY